MYDNNGRRTKLVLPNGINVLYSYDSASRLTNITYQGAATNRIDYAYWNDGNRASQESALVTYLLPDAVASATYNAANQQLTFGDYTIQYDLNGNMTNIVNSVVGITNNLYWTARNLLTNMTGSVSANFLYDGMGRRITRTVSGTTEKYLYDGLDIVLQKDGSDAIVASYLRGLAIDEPWQRTENGTNEVYLADALGSIAALADDDGGAATGYAYEPFGTTTEDGNPSTNPFKFTGREDDGTGMYHYRARYYHPVLGRFISEDPIGYAGGDINLYAYVGGDPINFIDPLGLDWLDCMTKCLADNDPLNSLEKLGLSGLGGGIPKKLLGLPRLPGSSPVTTLPSYLGLGHGTAKAGTNALRLTGRFFFPIWLTYGSYLAGVEIYCAAHCAGGDCSD